MSIYKRGSTYSYDFFMEGKRHTGNTGETSKAKAQEYVVDLKRKLRDEKTSGLKDITLAKLLELQLSSSPKAETSLVTYETRIKRLLGQLEGHFGFSPEMSIGDLKTEHVETLKTRRASEGMAPSTVAVEIGQLKAAYNLAKALGYRVNYSTVFKRPKHRPKMRALSLEEEAKLIEAMDPERRAKSLPWGSLASCPLHVRRGLQDLYDLTVFLLDTGCRHNEAVRCRWSDVSLDFKSIDVKRWKTGNETLVFTTKRLREVLERRSKGRKVGDVWLFAAAEDTSQPRPYRVTAISDMMDRLGFNEGGNEERYGRATVHSLRHTYASKLLRSGQYDLARTRDRLGQKSIKSTEIYAHLDKRADAKAAAEILDDLNELRDK